MYHGGADHRFVWSAWFLFGLLALPLSTARAQQGAPYIHSGADNLSWTIGNGLVNRKLTYSESTGLSTQSWIHDVTGTDFIKQPFPANSPFGPPGAEFAFHVGSRELQGFRRTRNTAGDFELVQADVEHLPRDGRQLRITLRAKGESLEVAVLYAVYPNYPVIRKSLSIANTGSAPVVLSHMQIEAVNIRSASPHLQKVSSYYGVSPREIFMTGRAEDCLLVQQNAQTGEGFALLNESPGWMKRTDLLNWGQGVAVGYDTDLFPFERKLEPGETFTTAASDTAFFVENKGLEDLHWILPGYVSTVLQRKGSAFRSPWFGNTWEPFFQNYDESAVKSILPAASAMGLDIYTIDTGWSKDYADNVPNPAKFPNGLSAIRSEFESKGMRLGMWVPVDVVSPQSRVYKEHPEWAIQDYLGNEKTAAFPGPHDRVMCLDSPYRKVAADNINRLIDAQHLAYVKLDLTSVFNAYGEAPGCHAKGHYHDNWAQSLEGIYEGIQFVTAEIYRNHPDILLDITFELWGQKHIIDYGLIDSADLDWMSNVDDQSSEAAGPLQARQLLYARGMAIPVETMLIGNLRATTSDIEDRFATELGSAPVLLGDLRKLTPEQIQWYREKINWFKKLRSEVPLNEGFFPLGSWRQPNALAWDGFARLSRSGEGVIVLFRNQSVLPRANFAIPTFPEGHYSLQSVVSRKRISVSAAELQHGMQVQFPDKHNIEILEVRKSE
jgi:alpha-galactosidase